MKDVLSYFGGNKKMTMFSKPQSYLTLLLDFYS